MSNYKGIKMVNKKEYMKKYREKNKEEISKKNKHYKSKNKEYLKIKNKEYTLKNREKINKQKREYYQENKKIISLKLIKKYNENEEYREKALTNSRNYGKINKLKKSKYDKIYKKSKKGKEAKKRDRLKNKIWYKKYQKEYNQIPEVKKRLSIRNYNLNINDPQYNIKKRLRSSLNRSVKKSVENKKINSKGFGIDWNKIIEHLKPFPKNIKLYHIDHIRPLCSFEFVRLDGSTDFSEIQKAFSPENHRWLTIEENLRRPRTWKKIN